MSRRVGLWGALVALVVALVALVAVVAISPPDWIRTLWEEESPSDFTGAAVPAIEEPPLVRLAVLGDSGTGSKEQLAVADEMAEQHDEHPYDGLMILGDMIYPDGDAALVDERIRDPYEPLLADGAEVVPVLGNHDYGSDEELEILEELGRDEPWYVESMGPLRIIVLDSVQVEDPAQTQWLADELSRPQSDRTWTIAAMHHPAYSAGHHGSSMDVREAWSDLFAEADVPLVLAGHDHDYQRSEPQDGVVYVVSGGGAKLRETGTDDFTAVSTSKLHYLDLLVYDDRLVGSAVDTSGRLIDRFIIAK
jgi:predicted phosphodiesterase